jgi:hypothetical protein
MLAHTKELLEYNNGYVSINPKFNKLIILLRTPVENGEGVLQVMMAYLMHSNVFTVLASLKNSSFYRRKFLNKVRYGYNMIWILALFQLTKELDWSASKAL